MKTSWGMGFAGAVLAVAGLAVPALADGMPGSVKDAPAKADEGRKLAFSWNIGGTTDYVFRGVSQNAADPAFQAGIDVTYGIAYVGIWGSMIDFGTYADGQKVASTEIDWYAGIKPVLGPVTFDLGVIYYTYPGALDGGVALGQVREQDYVELKLGASGSPFKNLTTGVTLFYSPQYTGGQGETITVEGTVGYELPKFYVFTPTISGTLGSTFGDASDAKDPFVQGNGEDSYLYWNAGIALAVDKLTLDFRYWDTDIKNNGTVASGFCTGTVFQCDQRFVFTAKITF
jgi:uncharacterized protein (TIGR02001 family)